MCADSRKNIKGIREMNDYREQVLKTLSKEFHEKSVSPEMVLYAVNNFCFNAVKLDRFKSELFYGKKKEKQHDWIAGDIISYSDTDPAMLHAALGIATESAEVAELIGRQLCGGGLNRVGLAEELGDLLYFVEVMAERLGLTTDQIKEINTAKLEARYGGGGFDAGLAAKQLDN